MSNYSVKITKCGKCQFSDAHLLGGEEWRVTGARLGSERGQQPHAQVESARILRPSSKAKGEVAARANRWCKQYLLLFSPFRAVEGENPDSALEKTKKTSATGIFWAGAQGGSLRRFPRTRWLGWQIIKLWILIQIRHGRGNNFAALQK